MNDFISIFPLDFDHNCKYAKRVVDADVGAYWNCHNKKKYPCAPGMCTNDKYQICTQRETVQGELEL